MPPKAGRCLNCMFEAAMPRINAQRAFSTTPRQLLRKRPSLANRAKAVDPVHQSRRMKEEEKLAEHLKPYTHREKRLLALKYTPEQLRAIEAGENAVSSEDIQEQGRFRTDPLRIEYMDDFATLRDGIDIRSVPNARSDATGRARKRNRATPRKDEEAVDPHMLRLSQKTGMTIPAIKRLRVKCLVNHRVVNQTRMGKIQSLYYLSIAGNENGMLGIGEGKAAEDEDGRRQAMMNAIRNMKPVPRYEERTIFGESEAKVGASVVQLSSRPPGFGNRCQHLIFELARAAGISDLAARTPRSRNKMNVVKAAFQALTKQRLPEEIARARGRKLVDVRGVYYGGLVH